MIPNTAIFWSKSQTIVSDILREPEYRKMNYAQVNYWKPKYSCLNVSYLWKDDPFRDYSNFLCTFTSEESVNDFSRVQCKSFVIHQFLHIVIQFKYLQICSSVHIYCIYFQPHDFLNRKPSKETSKGQHCFFRVKKQCPLKPTRNQHRLIHKTVYLTTSESFSIK